MTFAPKDPYTGRTHGAPAPYTSSKRLAKRGMVDGLEFALLVLLFLFYQFAAIQALPITAADANLWGSISLLLIMLWGCQRMIAAHAMNIWGAALWFRVACAVYFGFGGTVPYIVNYNTLSTMQSLYHFTDLEALKSNSINVAAIFFVLLGVQVYTTYTKGNALRPGERVFPLGTLTLLLLLVGGVIRYVIVLPFLLGVNTGILLSIFAMLSKAYTAGLMLLIILALRRGGLLIGLAFILVAIELATGILLFNKSDVMITFLCVVLGFYQHRPRLSTLLTSGTVAIVLFAAINPIIPFGRNTLAAQNSGQQIGTVSERYQIVEEYLNRSALASTDDNIQNSMLRLSYVNASTFVIGRYDAGQRDGTLGHLLETLVPRFLWPDKPDLSATGRDIYTQATGQQGSSISPGLPAEAYSNFGWVGVPLLMIPMGIILALLTELARTVMGQQRWIFLPIVLMSINVGVRADGHYVTDVVGAPLTILIMYMLLSIVERALMRR